MSSDQLLVHVVTAWFSGFVGLFLLGIAVPAIMTVVPDVVAHSWSHRVWKPGATMAAVLVGGLLLGVFELSSTRAAGAPSLGVWAALSILLAVVTLTAGGLLCVRRLISRSRKRSAVLRTLRSPRLVLPDIDGRSAPGAIAMRINARRAEYLAADWMAYLGADDCVVTPSSRDGGVDVRSNMYVAQVKHRQDYTGVEVVRQIHGVAAAEGRAALFFTTSSYSRDALAFASTAGVALFIMRITEGRLVPVGPVAQQLWNRRLESSDPVRRATR